MRVFGDDRGRRGKHPASLLLYPLGAALAGVGLIAVGFGLVVFGTVGGGIYALRKYNQLQAPVYFSTPTHTAPPPSFTPLAGERDVDSLIEGLPAVVQRVAKTIFSFSFIDQQMKSSIARAGELRRLTNKHLRTDARITSQFGPDVGIATPQHWIKYKETGGSCVNAVFPIKSNEIGAATQSAVTVTAVVASTGELRLQQLEYRNDHTGESINLLLPLPGMGPE